MRTLKFSLRVITCFATFGFSAMAGAWAQEPSRLPSGDGHAVGVVTGISGGSVSILSTGPASRTVKVGDLMGAGEEISTSVGAKVDVLWDHRALLTLNEETRLHIQEPHRGQTEVRLHRGTVRIALSYNAGRMTDRITLQTALARTVSRGGIMEATVMGEEQRSFFARLVNAPTVETLRVFEGQARVEPLSDESKPFSIKSGSEVSLEPGVPTSILGMHAATRSLQPLAVKEEHRGSPQPVTRQIVTAHVDLALEVEKEIQRTTAAGTQKDLPGTAAKGVILPTSTGLPSFPGTQTFAGGTQSARHRALHLLYCLRPWRYLFKESLPGRGQDLLNPEVSTAADC